MTEIGHSAGRATVSVSASPANSSPGDGSNSVLAGAGVELELEWAAVSDIGRRRAHNEDSFLAESPIFAVADGMGGHSAGDVASAAVVTRLSECVVSDFADPVTILPALRAATADIALAEDVREIGVGTTVTGIALTRLSGEPVWTVFNIGDSRVYLFEAGVLRQVTTDHSVVQELVDGGLISAEEAETHPKRNMITRAVGFNAEPFADLWTLPVHAATRLLVCSDGLTREVSDDRLRRHLGAGLSPTLTVFALVEAALASGGSDNITAIIVDVLHLGDDSDDSDDSDNDNEWADTVPRR